VKSVVGIDVERRCTSVIALLGRLNFSMDETNLVHVTEPMSLTMPYSAYGVLVESDDLTASIQEIGEAALAEASEQAAALGLHPKTLMSEGFPTKTLIELSEKVGAELIAVTSTVTGTIEAVFGGSVARGLAISAKQSVLVARDDRVSNGPLRAVLAINQSAFCEECIQQLIDFAPKGISHLTLLSIQSNERHHQPICPCPKIDAFAQRLTDSGIPSESLVMSGGIEETIHRLMIGSHSDLLIVCSQGHGFLDRMMTGSTSLHEVIHERYPVLLLRHK